MTLASLLTCQHELHRKCDKNHHAEEKGNEDQLSSTHLAPLQRCRRATENPSRVTVVVRSLIITNRNEYALRGRKIVRDRDRLWWSPSVTNPVLMSDSNAEPRPPERIEPLSDKAVGAVVALIRVVELYDPAVAHRAALRAMVANRVAHRLDSTIDASIFVASAALGDIDLSITRPPDPEANGDPTRTLLADTLVGRLPGLREVAAAVGSRREHWDGNGFPKGISGHQIPLAGRVLAAVEELVASPASGFVPNWERGRQRVEASSGTTLDPAIVRLVLSVPLDDAESPVIPSATIAALLDEARTRARYEPTNEASTIKTAISSAGDIGDVLRLFAETARDAVEARDVIILSSSDGTFATEPSARATRDGVVVSDPEQAIDFLIEGELHAGTTIEHASLDDGHIDTLLAPMFANDHCWGVIIARRSTTEDAFDATDLSALRHVASEAGSAVARTGHWAEMERMALCDQLTGLSNRHELYRILDDIFERPAIDRFDTALIMCDVDGLKIVNDTLGHQAGDRLLIDAAAALRGAIRDPERTTVCRIGGDEFCMVIDGGALLGAHEISSTIERLFARSGGSGETRTISCGIAFANDEITNRSALLRAADQNQYQTKRARKAERGQSQEAPVPVDKAPAGRRAIRE